MRYYDHLDIRVRNLLEARPFYEKLLPAIGFSRESQAEGWLQYATPGVNEAGEFIGITESANHSPNECRVAFWASSPAEVDRLSSILTDAGARNIEGPAFEDPNYYAVFFEDPSGNRLEICHRTVPS